MALVAISVDTSQIYHSSIATQVCSVNTKWPPLAKNISRMTSEELGDFRLVLETAGVGGKGADGLLRF